MNLKVKAKNLVKQKKDLSSHQDTEMQITNSKVISNYTGLTNAIPNLIFFIPRGIFLFRKRAHGGRC